MTIDPKVQFIIGIVVTIAIAVTGGTLSFSHLIPAEWIPSALQICAWLAFIGSSILTGLNGVAMTNASRLASVQSVPIEQKMESFARNPEVKAIVTTQALADATTSDKVVAGPSPAPKV